MSTQLLTPQELSENQRWEERHGEDQNHPSDQYDEFLRLGLSSDEAFEGFISFLEKQGAKVAKQAASHPFQKRNYLVQAAMDDVLKHYANGGSKPK